VGQVAMTKSTMSTTKQARGFEQNPDLGTTIEDRSQWQAKHQEAGWRPHSPRRTRKHEQGLLTKMRIAQICETRKEKMYSTNEKQNRFSY
jgi:hypothetical protein